MEWWELGFSYEAVIDAWQDARLALAIEKAWNGAAQPAEAEARWMASADEFAFRWFVNGRMAELLDAAGVTWRLYVIRRSTTPPPERARTFLEHGGCHA
jgi:hypothetical protein